jgi:hypothetical protein
MISTRRSTALWLLFGLACSGQNEEIEEGTVDSASSDSAALDSGTGDSGSASYSLVLGEAPPDFTLTDTNPASITYDQPVTVSDKTGFVTGWYFFKSS